MAFRIWVTSLMEADYSRRRRGQQDHASEQEQGSRRGLQSPASAAEESLQVLGHQPRWRGPPSPWMLASKSALLLSRQAGPAVVLSGCQPSSPGPERAATR